MVESQEDEDEAAEVNAVQGGRQRGNGRFCDLYLWGVCHTVGCQKDFVAFTCEEYARLYRGHPVGGQVDFVSLPVRSMLDCTEATLLVAR